MKIKLIGGAVLAGALLLATPATAAVTFDPATGTGFVGKGDVQLAYGWNNKEINERVVGVSFTYETTGAYTLVCSRIHQRHGYQAQTFPNKVTSLQAELAHEVRRNAKGAVTGFTLKGFGEQTVSGGDCPPGWPNEVSRTANDDAGSRVGVFAHHDADPADDTDPVSVMLDWAPAAAM